MKFFDYEKYLKNNLLLKEEKEVEESFKDRVSAKKKTVDSPMGDLATIFHAVEKEANGDYDVVYKKGAILILPDLASGVVGRIIGVAITQNPGNKAITVAFTNGTVDNSGAIHMTQPQRFNPKDIEGILDMCADMIDQVTTEDESSGTVDEAKSNLQKMASDLYDKLMTTKPYNSMIDDYLVDDIMEEIIKKPFTTWDELNDKQLAKIIPFLQAVIKWVDSGKEFVGLDMGWDGKKLTSTDEDENMD